MIQELQIPELTTALASRKERFNRCRIANGRVTLADLVVSFPVVGETTTSPTEDNTLATKTYTEKIKGGYFGKRRTRF